MVLRRRNYHAGAEIKEGRLKPGQQVKLNKGIKKNMVFVLREKDGIVQVGAGKKGEIGPLSKEQMRTVKILLGKYGYDQGAGIQGEYWFPKGW